MPPNPKRPSRSAGPADEQILHADDPRPQRVTQYPSSGAARRPLKKGEHVTSHPIFDSDRSDQEMQAHYGMSGAEFKPAFLYVERGPGLGQLLELRHGSTVIIGRASISDLRLQHPSISRRHCQVRRIGENFYVKDLGSQNGTFVNKQRLTTEIEIKVGDYLALGTALVLLRGPMTRSERVPNPAPQRGSFAGVESSRTTRQSRAQFSTAVLPRAQPMSRALMVAILLCACAFGAAIILGIALWRATSQPAAIAASRPTLVAPSTLPTATSSSERERLIQQALERKMREQRSEPLPAPSAPAEPPVAKAAIEEPAPAPAVVRPAPTRPPPARPAKKASPPPAPVVAAAPAVSAEESAASKTAPKKAQVLAPYERGNAEASLDLAKKMGERDLAQKLTKFIQAYDAANDAVAANNGVAAISNFTKALRLDEELSSGWGRYGAEIRRHLSILYTLVGMQHAANGDNEKARQSFQAALKHDPSSVRAKDQLEKLGGRPAPKSPDEAFNEDAPAQKTAKKPKSIDDAFGD